MLFEQEDSKHSLPLNNEAIKRCLPQPWAVENLSPAVSASETKELVNDLPRGRKLSQLGYNQDSNPSSFDSRYCDL